MSRTAHPVREGGAVAAPAPLRFAIGIPASAGEADLAATLASLAASAAAAGGRYEILVAVNGPGAAPAALGGVAAFAAAAGLAVESGAVPSAGSGTAPAPADAAAGTPALRVLRLAPRSKVAAWNAIRIATRAPIIVFTDADVRVAPAAIGLLVGGLEADPALALLAGREEARLAPGDGLAARVAALPYRFDFGNVPGRLYALRRAALDEPMPAHVLHEDAYLTVRLGRARFAKAAGARVYLRPPTTWRDYLAQRVRNELGKLQLAREFPALERTHGFGRYPWRAFLRELAWREYPLVALLVATRLWARGRARRAARRGFPTGWGMLPTTKRWEGAGEAPSPAAATPATPDRAERGAAPAPRIG